MKNKIKIFTSIILVIVFLFSVNINTYAAIMNEVKENTNSNESINVVNNENINQNNEKVDNNTNVIKEESNNNQLNNQIVNENTNEKTQENNQITEEKEDINLIEKNENIVEENTTVKNEVDAENNIAEQKKKNTKTDYKKTKDNGIYKMAVGEDSSKTIEVAGSSTSNNAKVDIWSYGNVPAQKFYFTYDESGFYKITAMHTGKSLTVKGNKLTEGTEIVQDEYQGLDSQKWILRDSQKNGWVISLQSNPELSISIDGKIANGSKLVLKKTQDNKNQMFYLFDITKDEQHKVNGTYRIAVGTNLEKAIEIKENIKLQIGKYGNKSSQKFNLEYIDGYYKITELSSAKSLTVKDNNLQQGEEITLSEYQGLDSQKWILRDSNKNGWIISLFNNPQLSITIKGNIVNGASLILSKTEDNNKQMYNVLKVSTEEGIKKVNGIYKMAVGKDSSKTIEVAGSSTADNAKVDIWSYGNVPAQKFYFTYEDGFYKITAMHTGKSLTVKDNKIAEGTDIVQAEYQGLDSQKWIFRDTTVNGWVISPQSNPELSLTVEGKISNGSKIVLKKTEDSNNQMFYLFNITGDEQYKENGIYKMAVGKDSSKTIEVAGSSKSNNAKVDIWSYGNVPAQKFYFTYDKSGFYKITAMHTGKSLTVKGNKLAEGTEIVQEEYKGLDSQKWILRDSNKNGWIISLQSNPELSITIKGNIKNGAILILSKTKDNNNQMFYLYNITNSEQQKVNSEYKILVGANSSKGIEIAGSSKSNNAKVDIWDYGNVPAQKFNFEYIDGFYKITATHTGKSLTVKNNNLVEGAEIVQYDYKGLDSQKWILRDSGKNGWVISLLSNPELSITIKGNIKNGAILILSATKDNNNQMFYLYKTKITIVINPGHGGSDPGCANGGIVEKNVTLQIAKKIQANLSKYPEINAILTRTSDYFIDLAPRAMIARNNNADLYISLHINDEASHRATGSQMYVPFYEGTKHYNSNMTKLANLIQDKLGAIGIRENLSGGITRRNIDQLPKYQYLMNGQVVQADYYADIRHAMKGDTMDYGPDLNTNTGVPAILVEHCFMNSSDSRFLDSDYDLQRIADADTAAIVEYFNL